MSLDKKRITDFFKNIGKNIGIGVILILTTIPILYLLSYLFNIKSIDPSIFLIATITGWCTICFKMWLDAIRGKTKGEKIYLTLIFLFGLPLLGIYVFALISPQPILDVYLQKAFFSWYFGSIIGLLYEVVKPKKTGTVND